MCGIAGKIYFSAGEVSSEAISAMNNTLIHRGPDDDGVYISADKKVGLGHRRLSIIDLSSLGHQPMSYQDRYQIVFNGEIYNFQEKRVMLEGLGYVFKSKTDTEVLMALYDKFRKKCVDHLRGMFAFAIYDEKNRTLFCARDRVGKKPFKYYTDNSVFIFASELKAILTQAEYRKEIDPVAIHHYLTLGYCPAPLTGFKDMQKLEPAHHLFIDLKTGKIEKERYWKLDFAKKINLTETQWQERILDKLRESIESRMIADVPLGVLLSGGIDSSAIVALMREGKNRTIKTFSVGFEERQFNELESAQLVAQKFSTQHTEMIVRPNVIDALPNLLYQAEEPFADPSILPTYYINKVAKEQVTVVLNGDGGDENFAGYRRYSLHKFSLLFEEFKWINNWFCLPIAKFLASKFQSDFLQRAYLFSKSLQEKYDYRYANYTCKLSMKMKDSLYQDGFAEKISGLDSNSLIAEKFKEANVKDKLDQALYADFSTYLPDDLLVKADTASMAVSIEGRSPFLDHEFLELSAMMPFSLKVKGLFFRKYILKKAFEHILPKEIIEQKKKGFGIPVAKWLRGDLREYVQSILLSEKAAARGFFKKEVVEKMLTDHMESRHDYSRQIWTLLCLELWCLEYFE
ncbi:MAG: Asparagine synthase [Candidatus Moranbacteria bacterium GW2011_GWA2_39_41]|nr:MAG: Asparagine synthase [Candidatus Moranbacteria bacterium GW2011_GWA2_39_41]